MARRKSRRRRKRSYDYHPRKTRGFKDGKKIARYAGKGIVYIGGKAYKQLRGPHPKLKEGARVWAYRVRHPRRVGAWWKRSKTEPPPPPPEGYD